MARSDRREIRPVVGGLRTLLVEVLVVMVFALVALVVSWLVLRIV